jgi:predicted RNA-binding Zn-ribbon protein involved in translation (DUF1610 family)
MEQQSLLRVIVDNFLPVVLIVSLLISGGVSLWKLFKDRENEAMCPRCGKHWVAKRLGENMLGIFRKNQPRLFQSKGAARESDHKMVEYARYKVHYKCEDCGYEWDFLKSRKL